MLRFSTLVALASAFFGLFLQDGRAPDLTTSSATSSAAVQDDETFTLKLGNPSMDIELFLDTYAKVSGRRFTWNMKQIQNRIITGSGEFTFKKSQADFVFQRLLLANDLAISSLTDGTSDIAYIEDVKTTQFAKQNARVVRLEDVDKAASRPAEIITTVIPLKNIPCDIAQRCLQNFIQDQRIGFVVTIDEANAVVITNFPRCVATAVAVLTEADRIADSETAKAWRKLFDERRAAAKAVEKK